LKISRAAPQDLWHSPSTEWPDHSVGGPAAVLGIAGRLLEVIAAWKLANETYRISFELKDSIGEYHG
jgi:hypothetical protein